MYLTFILGSEYGEAYMLHVHPTLEKVYEEFFKLAEHKIQNAFMLYPRLSGEPFLATRKRVNKDKETLSKLYETFKAPNQWKYIHAEFDSHKISYYQFKPENLEFWSISVNEFCYVDIEENTL
jgi:hypothetical protein